MVVEDKAEVQLPEIEVTGDDEGALGFNPQADSPSADNPDDQSTLTPDGETPPSDATPDESTPAGKRIKELTEKLHKVEEDPDVLEAKARRLRRAAGQEPDQTPERPAAPAAAPVPPATPDLEGAKKQLLDSLAKDPIGTILAVAKEIADQSTAPLQDNVFDTTVFQYRMARQSDPAFRRVTPIFNQLLTRLDKRVLRGKGAQAIWSTLEATELLALGQQYRADVAAEAGGTPAKRPVFADAPDFGSRASGRPAGTAKATVKIPKTYIIMGRNAGLSDREIYEEYVRQQAEEE